MPEFKIAYQTTCDFTAKLTHDPACYCLTLTRSRNFYPWFLKKILLFKSAIHNPLNLNLSAERFCLWHLIQHGAHLIVILNTSSMISLQIFAEVNEFTAAALKTQEVIGFCSVPNIHINLSFVHLIGGQYFFPTESILIF